MTSAQMRKFLRELTAAYYGPQDGTYEAMMDDAAQFSERDWQRVAEWSGLLDAVQSAKRAAKQQTSTHPRPMGTCDWETLVARLDRATQTLLNLWKGI